MTIYHNHHIIPRHMGGGNEPENLISLTIEDHAEAHRQLFDEHGKIEDWIAWKALSRQISGAEALMLLLKRPKSQEVKDKLRVSHTRPEIREIHKKVMKGNQHSKGNCATKGTIWITNGIRNRMVKDDSCPSGWNRGITCDKGMGSHKGTIWITNGIEDKRINNGSTIPSGWKRGRTTGVTFKADKTSSGRIGQYSPVHLSYRLRGGRYGT